LDLIWVNCLTYNASPVRRPPLQQPFIADYYTITQDHPLRQCAKRLQVKAEKLLKNITDRKERTDPLIPSDLPGRSPSAIFLKSNGVNGRARSLSSTPAPTTVAKSVIRIPPIAVPRKRSGIETTFLETPAIIRTVEGMSAFKILNEEMDLEDSNIEARLRAYTLEDSEDSLPEPESEEEHAVLGDKRKLLVLSAFLSTRPTPCI
jgi:transcriptional activator SPT7